MSEKSGIPVIILSRDANGIPTLSRLNVPPSQIERGELDDLAKEVAAKNGYKEPMMVFDENELLALIAKLTQKPANSPEGNEVEIAQELVISTIHMPNPQMLDLDDDSRA